MKQKNKKKPRNKSKKAEKKPIEKKSVGRPTKYKPEYCNRMISWFDRDLTIIKELQKVSNGDVVTIKEEVPNSPPMFGVFARKEIGVYHQTMIDWCAKYPEFNEAYRECKNIQKEFIIMGCLLGHFNSSFGRFTMKNISEWRDKILDEPTKDQKEGLTLAYSLEGAK